MTLSFIIDHVLTIPRSKIIQASHDRLGFFERDCEVEVEKVNERKSYREWYAHIVRAWLIYWLVCVLFISFNIIETKFCLNNHDECCVSTRFVVLWPRQNNCLPLIIFILMSLNVLLGQLLTDKYNVFIQSTWSSDFCDMSLKLLIYSSSV
jgi:hypothetical protein